MNLTILNRSHIGAVAVEHLIAKRHSVSGLRLDDADLLAIRALVAGIPASSARCGAFAFDERRGHIVEQKIVLQVEQRAQLVFKVLFKSGLVRKELVQGAVEPVVGDLFGRQAEQILQGQAFIDGLRCRVRSKDGRGGRQQAPRSSLARRYPRVLRAAFHRNSVRPSRSMS